MKKENLFRVGVFDSGIGGLTVLAECQRRIPHAQYIYLGDNGRAPYGNRPAEEIARFAEEGVEELSALGAEAVLIACNTATAVCIEKLRAKYAFPIVGVEPAVKRAASCCRNALVLATQRTAESGRLRSLIARFPQTRFTVAAAPRLAGAIEEGLVRGTDIDLEEHLPRVECDGVVLGCTHYAFFTREISEFYNAPAFDGAAGTAERLKSLINFGTADHRFSDRTTGEPFSKSQEENASNSVIFAGKWAKINRSVYFYKRMF